MTTLLPAGWKIPEALQARIGDRVGRQRALAAEGHLLLVLHAPPEADDDTRKGRFFWRDPHGVWKSSALGSGLHALKAHLAEFADRLDQLDGRMQTATTAEDYYQVLQAAAPLHRAARNLHAALQQARELFPADRDLVNLRDAAYDLERTAELLHGDAKNGLDYTVARQTEAQARRSFEMSVSAHRLNLLAASFFPIATLGAIFGMNITHGFETWPAPATFWGVLALGLFSGLFLTWAIASRPREPFPTAREPRPGMGRPNSGGTKQVRPKAVREVPPRTPAPSDSAV